MRSENQPPSSSPSTWPTETLTALIAVSQDRRTCIAAACTGCKQPAIVASTVAPNMMRALLVLSNSAWLEVTIMAPTKARRMAMNRGQVGRDVSTPSKPNESITSDATS
eukprot:2881540-Rhodomonas_salina.1